MYLIDSLCDLQIPEDSPLLRFRLQDDALQIGQYELASLEHCFGACMLMQHGMPDLVPEL